MNMDTRRTITGGASTKKAGTDVSAETIRAPAATRIAIRFPFRQAGTTAASVMTPQIALRMRMLMAGYAGELSLGAPAW